MALPVSLSDVDFVGPMDGPFKIGSSFYIVARDASTTSAIKVLKADSDDPTGTWTEQDSANRPSMASAVVSIVAKDDGTTIHIATKRNTAVASAEYHTFSTSGNTWGTTNETINTSESAITNALFDIAVRSDGDVLVAYYGSSETIMGTNYNRVKLARRESGTWTDNIDPTGISKAAEGFVDAAIVLADQTNDRLHYFYYGDTNTDFNYSTLLSNNTWGHQDTVIDSTASAGDNVSGNYSVRTTAIAFTDTTRKIRCSYVDSGGGINIAGFNDADSPSASVVATGVNDNANVTAFQLAVDGTTQHYLYTVTSSANIYHSETGAGDDTWATDDTELTVGTSPAVVFSANVYDQGGAVLAYLYTDNGSEEYNERSLTSTTKTGTGSATLPALTTAGSGVMSRSGTAAVTLGAITTSATGVMGRSGSAAISLPAITASSAGAITKTGTASVTFPAFTASATGTVAKTGSAAISLPALVASAAGLMGRSGTAAATLPALTTNAAGVITKTATGAPTLPAITASASGVMGRSGTGAATLPAFTVSATGSIGGTVTGTAAASLPAITVSSAGTITKTGTASVTFPAFTASAAGVIGRIGTAAPTLPALTASATGTISGVVSGTAGPTLPALTASAAGTVTAVAAETATVDGGYKRRVCKDEAKQLQDEADERDRKARDDKARLERIVREALWGKEAPETPPAAPQTRAERAKVVRKARQQIDASGLQISFAEIRAEVAQQAEALARARFEMEEDDLAVILMLAA